MVTIGSDLPLKAYHDALPFYRGGFASGDLCRDILNQLASWESGEYFTTSEYVVEMNSFNALPFVNLFPWTQKSLTDLEDALQMLRTYLQATKPMIVMALSQRVTSCAMNSFRSNHRDYDSSFVSEIGKPILARYDEDLTNPSNHNLVIVIPSYHPGHIQYEGKGAPLFASVLSKTYAICWLAMSIAARYAIYTDLSKLELLEMVCKEVNMKTGPASKFGRTFDDVKARLAAYRRKKFQQLEQDEAVHIFPLTPAQLLEPSRQAIARRGFVPEWHAESTECRKGIPR